ncbi:MAG TPA: hypothetical protein GXZ48_05040 [Acholeplasmataceae bacterium]|nr:hypothetical protein [Acholeplasmataceae bacterium]
MYKKFTIALLILLLFSYINVSANSAQMVFDPELGIEMLPITDEDISVHSEELIFDFQKYNMPNHGGIFCDIIATYNFHNSGETKTIKMGFPFISSFNKVDTNKIEIVKDDAQKIDYQIYYGKRISYWSDNDNPNYINIDQIESLTFEEAIEGSITKSLLSTSEKAYLYTYNLTSINQNIGLIRFKKSQDNCTIITLGNNGYSNEPSFVQGYDLITLTKHKDNNDNMISILVLGNDILDIETAGYDNYKGKEVNYRAYNNLIIREEIILKDFISNHTENRLKYYETYEYFDENKGEYDFKTVELNKENAKLLLEYEIALAMDEYNYYTFDELERRAWEFERIVIITYDATIIKNEDNFLGIKYKYQTGANFRFSPAIYKINYISNPSKNWSSFGVFTVTIIPPENYYVIDSSIEFNLENGVYTVKLNELPESNISFSVSSDPNPVYNRFTLGNFLLGLVFFFSNYWWVILLVIGFLIIIIYLINRNQRK